MAEGPGEEIAKSVAENVGGMPLVHGAGKMGGSLLDLLSRLISGMQGGGGRMERPPTPPPNMPAGYDPKTGIRWEQPRYDPMQAQQGADPMAGLMQGGGGGAGNFMALLMKLLQQGGGQPLGGGMAGRKPPYEY